MTRIVERAEHEKSEGGVVADLKASFRSNRKLLVAMVLGLPLILTFLVWLLLPRESQKEITLEVAYSTTPALSDLQKSLGQEESTVNPETTGQQAVSFLRAGRSDPVEVIPKYDYTTAQVDVLLRSRSKETLDDFGSEEVTGLVETGFRERGEEAQSASIENQLRQLNGGIDATQASVSELERQIEASSAEDAGDLEAQRENALAYLASLETKKAYFEQTYEGLSELMEEQTFMEVATESETREATRLASALMAAALLGLVAAGALTVRTTAEQAARSAGSPT